MAKWSRVGASDIAEGGSGRGGEGPADLSGGGAGGLECGGASDVLEFAAGSVGLRA